MQSKLTHRNAFTLTELVVAAALMVSVMAVIAPLTVHSARLLQDTRHQQLVMDELSNELERLTMLAPDERDKAIAELVPSEHVRWMLPSAEITAETVRDEDGVRLVLSLNWDRPGRPRPITFVGWLDSTPGEEEKQIALAPDGLMKTEPTALAAGVESDANNSLRPEASADGSRNRAFSSALAPGGSGAAAAGEDS
jgi:hypothetical protein